MSTKSLTFEVFGKDRSASKTIRGVRNEAEDVSSTFKRMGPAMAAGLAVAGAAVVSFGVDSVKAFAEAEQAQNRLNFAYEQFPSLADVSLDAIRRLNEEMANKTRFDDDAYAMGQAQLAQYGLTGQQLMELTPLLADYAAKTGKDLPTAASDLGKALLGQGRALKDVGIDFEDTGSVAGNFTAIMDGLRGQVGGFAEQDADTAAGKLDMLWNKFGELQEQVGEELMPTLDTFMDFLNDPDAVAAFAATVGDLAEEFGDVKSMVEDIQKIVDWWNAGGLAKEETRDVMDDNLIEGGGLLGGMAQWSRDMETAWKQLWGIADQETRTGVDNVRGGMGGGFSAISGDMSLFQQNYGTQWGTTWTDADGRTRAGMGTVAASTGGGLLGLLGQVLGWSGSLGGQFGSAWAGADAQTVAGWGGIEGSTGTGVSKVGAKVGEIPGVVKSPFGDAGRWLRGAGENIVEGLIGGISSMIGSAARTAANLAAAAVQAAKDALDINSPSGVFRDIGENVGAGFDEGIEKAMDSSHRTMEALVAAPTAGAGSGSPSAPSFTIVLESRGGIDLTDYISARIEGHDSVNVMTSKMGKQR